MSEAENRLQEFLEAQKIAEQMIPVLGVLYRDRTHVITICGTSIHHMSDLEIIKQHQFAAEYLGQKITVHDTFPILERLVKMENIGPARIDVGKLAGEMQMIIENERRQHYLEKRLMSLVSLPESLVDSPTDVVLYGFGRIGRLVARVLIEKTGGGNKMLLRAIVVRPRDIPNDLEKRATLFKNDSVHGPFNGIINLNKEKNQLIINGVTVQLIYAKSPSDVDYTAYGIKDAVLVDNTGIWRDRKGLGVHLAAKGIAKVLLTAPAKGDIPNIVAGVNDDTLSLDEKIFSAASCTTNAIVPFLNLIHNKFTINSVHVETVHSYTNDQNLLDNNHSKERRGRAAPLNMVLTSTGAASAVAKAIPDLKGKITGSAIRVPTPNVSLAMLILNLEKETTKDDINKFIYRHSLHSRQIGYELSNEAVSSDMIGDRHAGVLDSSNTIVDGNRAILYIWYDNEFGYTCQTVRVIQTIAGITHPKFPEKEPGTPKLIPKDLKEFEKSIFK